MNILFTVCVRAGSKGLKGKNFIKINNRYLISYTLDVAIKSKLFTHIVVSTDSRKIRALKKNYKKVDFIKRPKNLATDGANKLDAIRHALKYSDSIHNLYTELRDYSQGNNLTILDNSTYDLLIDYIYSIIEINDIYIDDYEYETGNEINDE